MLLLNFQITLSLFVCMAFGVFLGNTIWDYKSYLMPMWFKIALALTAISFLISLFSLIMVAIWSISV